MNRFGILRQGLQAATILLSIMISPNMDRSVFNEDVIESIIALMRVHLVNHIIPSLSCTGHTASFASMDVCCDDETPQEEDKEEKEEETAAAPRKKQKVTKKKAKKLGKGGNSISTNFNQASQKGIHGNLFHCRIADKPNREN
jgi:hypothetical protein